MQSDEVTSFFIAETLQESGLMFEANFIAILQ